MVEGVARHRKRLGRAGQQSHPVWAERFGTPHHVGIRLDGGHLRGSRIETEVRSRPTSYLQNRPGERLKQICSSTPQGLFERAHEDVVAEAVHLPNPSREIVVEQYRKAASAGYDNIRTSHPVKVSHGYSPRTAAHTEGSGSLNKRAVALVCEHSDSAV